MRSEEVRAAIASAYRQPEWAIFFEVADGTGSNKRRSADAVAVNMWPSRGMAINGFEIKVDRSDWKRELANPAKAESVARFCDFWWVAAPKGLIDSKELPHGWGLVEVDEKIALRIKVQAKERKPEPVSRSFFTSLCRSKAYQDERTVDALVEKKLTVLREQDRARNAAAIEHRLKAASEITKQHAAFANAMVRYGKLRHMDEDEIVRALEMLDKMGVLGEWGQLRSLINTVKSFARTVEHVEATYLTKEKDHA